MAELSLSKPQARDAEVERRREALGRWKQRSRTIHFWRLVLPGAIAVILLALIGGGIVRGLLSRETDETASTEGVRLVNPRFYGRDERGQAFVIAAKEALRDTGPGGLVTVTEPEVTLNSEGERTSRIRADRGTYREDQQVLRLEGNVRLEDDGGYRFRTDEAIVDTKANTVRGTKPLEGVGPVGTIAADSYAVYDQGARTRFEGRVRARVERGAPAARGETR